MTKHSFNISKFCKEASNEIIYEINSDGDRIAFSDKRGIVAFITDNNGVLEEFKAKKCTVTERNGLYNLVNKIIEAKDDVPAEELKINFPIYDNGIRSTGTMVKIGSNFKVVNTNKLSIFDYLTLSTSANKYSGLIMVCSDCYGVIMPVNPNTYNIRNI